MKRLRLRRPSPALIVATVSLVVALGGTSYAALNIPKNSVGSKQLKKNAVTSKKIKNGAVTQKKLANNLTVANALHAGAADNATNAGTANNIAPPEGIHVIGASGEPAFQNGCSDVASTSHVLPVGFFKDKEGTVHLQGAFTCPAAGNIAFQLPAGYEPANGALVLTTANDGSSGTTLGVVGPGLTGLPAGAVVLTTATAADTTGITFRPGA